MTAECEPQSLTVTAADGLRLHASIYNAHATGAVPVVCLPGLARTAADFDTIARAIAGDTNGKSRRVIAIDYRGRGKSEYDKDWRNYDLRVENSDILQVMTAADVGEAIFLGTSRGGIHIMIMAATRPAAVRAAILNDIGPVLEAKGLARIKGYVGKLPQPRSWNDAVEIAKRVMGAQFPSLGEEEWLAYARLTFDETKSGFRPRYDSNLMKTLDLVELDKPLPTLWPQFQGLRHARMLALRGENSDILSQATLEEMAQRHPACETHVVAGQGHAPLLLDAPAIQRVLRFIRECDHAPPMLAS